MKCTHCSGTGKRTVFTSRQDCWDCGGSGINGPEWLQLIVSHRGQGILGERVAKEGKSKLDELGKMLKNASREQLQFLLDRGLTPDGALRAVRVRSVNPCKRCGTFDLEEQWTGSAYCSQNCCDADAQSGDIGVRRYAEDMIECARERGHYRER